MARRVRHDWIRIRTSTSPTMAARRKRPATRVTEPSLIRLITPSASIAVKWASAGTDTGLQREAIRWTHLVRNRARWVGSEQSADQQDQHARDLLTRIGITEPQRQQLAKATEIRVSLPYSEESVGWEWRILPWEYILSAGTRDLRTGSVLIPRQLVRRGRLRPPRYGKVLFVQSAPGRLAQEWDFDDERKLVASCTKAAEFDVLDTPTLAQLRTRVQSFNPDVVHLAGFDTHQGLELVKEKETTSVMDGYLMAAGGGVEPVSASTLAEALCSGKAAPSLVMCNIWNSAARTAPMLVAKGVRSVVGFQDQLDDALGEIFVGNFYAALATTGDVESAFQAAWKSLQVQRRPLRGTGIVLWTGGEMADTPSVRTLRKTETTPARSVLSPESVDAPLARSYIPVAVEPEPQFSYGLLHNDRDLFKRFVVHNLSDQQLVGLEVFVELHSNEGTYPYRLSFNLDGPVRDLARDVRVALTSSLARTLDEVLRTSLYVQVRWGKHELFTQTFPVTMAPVDQWADTDADRIFLPSFIFPRDRAVRAVIRSAEQFMTALRDDPGAGFDGYQSLDPELANPAQSVDHQVQALWYSVVYRVPVSYINPPPTYSIASQRIRTPSEIVAGGFGTCIDLALMLASCLEAIEVYPVLFLLDDHAFPGYWRTDVARTDFRTNVAAAPAEQ